jgi:predicted RNA binding protein YcfA (HicA-like mRNA interferase family)
MPRVTPVDWRRFERFVASVGCRFVRINGDHHIWEKPGVVRPVVVPRYKSIPPYIIKTNLRTLGISTKEYLRLLEKL